MADRKYNSYQYLEMHFQRYTVQESEFGVCVSLIGVNIKSYAFISRFERCAL